MICLSPVSLDKIAIFLNFCFGDDCSALWRPGTGPQFWKSRRTVASFKNFDDDFFQQGLRIQSIHVKKGIITDAEFKQKLLEERAVYQRILNPTTQ